MTKLFSALGVSATTLVLIAGLIVGSARAQDANVQDGSGSHGNAAGNSAIQPDAKAPPIAVGGCWDGTSIDGSLEDQSVGAGAGWIGIIQKQKTIKGGKKGSFYSFAWDNLDFAQGTLSGKASATGFVATGLAGGKCRVKLIGTLTNAGNNISGTYAFIHCGSFDNHVGTFDFPFDPAGC